MKSSPFSTDMVKDGKGTDLIHWKKIGEIHWNISQKQSFENIVRPNT